MIKIRALGTKELKQVLTLLKQYGHEELEYSVLRRLRQLYVPLHVLSQLLPPQWQFMPGIYVAVARDDVMGLVWLTQDGHRNNRWSIDELIIDPDQSTYDIGTQLAEAYRPFWLMSINHKIRHWGCLSHVDFGAPRACTPTDTPHQENSLYRQTVLKACEKPRAMMPKS